MARGPGPVHTSPISEWWSPGGRTAHDARVPAKSLTWMLAVLEGGAYPLLNPPIDALRLFLYTLPELLGTILQMIADLFCFLLQLRLE
jgi:hypothetical protein